jgi:type VI secretion system protein ImpA
MMAKENGPNELVRDVMDIDTMLLPIDARSPCGEDMSFSKEFDQIAEMRRFDDPSLDQGAWVTSLKHADWPGAARQCTDLLRTRTKDLRLALWLTEARSMSDGHRGLADGLKLCAELCASHWPDLYPRPDGGDMEERIGNIAWLLQRITDMTQTMPITHSRKGERLSLRQLAQARIQDARAVDFTPTPGTGSHIGDGTPLTAAHFRLALADTPAAELRQTLTAQQDAEAALHRWQSVVDAQLGQDGPSFVAAREALAQATHDITRLMRDVGIAPLETARDSLHGAQHHATQANPAINGANPTTDRPHSEAVGAVAHMPLTLGSSAPGVLRAPKTRGEALQQLREVAAFFRQTEPHSPVAYLADKAVKWGDMPLHQWLQEVIKDNSAISHLNELLGLQGPHDAESHP